MEKLITSLLLMINIMSMSSQSDYDNLRKYWFYKSKLNNNLIKVGLERGESIPFNQRGDGSGIATPGGQFKWNKTLHIGDGTSTLGLYIATLATV